MDCIGTSLSPENNRGSSHTCTVHVGSRWQILIGSIPRKRIALVTVQNKITCTCCSLNPAGNRVVPHYEWSCRPVVILVRLYNQIGVVNNNTYGIPARNRCSRDIPYKRLRGIGCQTDRLNSVLFIGEFIAHSNPEIGRRVI